MTLVVEPDMKLYNFKGLAGCVSQQVARQTKTLVGIYQSEQSGLETDPDLPWATVCEVHNTLVCHSTLHLAKGHAADPMGWCQYCRAKDNRYVLVEDPVQEPFTLEDLLKNNGRLNEGEKEDFLNLEEGETLPLDEFTVKRIV